MTPPHMALFATCLVDLFHPPAGEATVRLLCRLALRVTYPANHPSTGMRGKDFDENS